MSKWSGRIHENGVAMFFRTGRDGVDAIVEGRGGDFTMQHLPDGAERWNGPVALGAHETAADAIKAADTRIAEVTTEAAGTWQELLEAAVELNDHSQSVTVTRDDLRNVLDLASHVEDRTAAEQESMDRLAQRYEIEFEQETEHEGMEL